MRSGSLSVCLSDNVLLNGFSNSVDLMIDIEKISCVVVDSWKRRIINDRDELMKEVNGGRKMEG